MSATIGIIPYSNHWPEEYNHPAAARKAALGDYARVSLYERSLQVGFLAFGS